MLSSYPLPIGLALCAAGHYARVDTVPGAPSLLREGTDAGKDQSYFLSLVRREAFPRVRAASPRAQPRGSPCAAQTLFPLGGMRKEEVRSLAAEAGLGTATKGESMGICFIGKRDFGGACTIAHPAGPHPPLPHSASCPLLRRAAFLSEYLTMQEGDVETLEGGAVVGRHVGLARYTVGQGARLSGQHVRYFVVGKDQTRNTLLVAPGGDHPALYRRHVYVRSPPTVVCALACPDWRRPLNGWGRAHRYPKRTSTGSRTRRLPWTATTASPPPAAFATSADGWSAPCDECRAPTCGLPARCPCRSARTWPGTPPCWRSPSAGLCARLGSCRSLHCTATRATALGADPYR